MRAARLRPWCCCCRALEAALSASQASLQAAQEDLERDEVIFADKMRELQVRARDCGRFRRRRMQRAEAYRAHAARSAGGPSSVGVCVYHWLPGLPACLQEARHGGLEAQERLKEAEERHAKQVRCGAVRRRGWCEGEGGVAGCNGCSCTCGPTRHALRSGACGLSLPCL